MKIYQTIVLTATLFLSVLLLAAGCSQPVLEPAECIDARVAVKKFYSYHIGNEMKPSAEYLDKRRGYLSADLQKSLAGKTASETDYFTQTADYPKAFRAGACENAGKDRTSFEILLFWRRNETNIQRPIKVEAIRENGQWVVDKVTPKE